MTNGKSRSYRVFVFLILVLIMGNIVFSYSTRGQEQDAPGQPEIIVEDIQLSDEEPMEGDNITISALIRNNKSEVNNVTMIYYIDSFEIGNITGIQLNAGESKWYNISWEAQAGDYDVSVVLKYRGMMIQENKLSKEVSVEPEPIGDVYSLLVSFVVILLTVFVSIIIHSLRKSIRT
ncbi:MAG: CARDB domain-containing protein [Candidatus Thermoplasmatota archaeon]